MLIHEFDNIADVFDVHGGKGVVGSSGGSPEPSQGAKAGRGAARSQAGTVTLPSP